MRKLFNMIALLGTILLAHKNLAVYAAQSSQCNDNDLKIAYTSDYKDGKSDIYITDIAGEFRRNLTQNVGYNRAPSWSPDGSQLAFASKRDGNWEIYIIDTSGENLSNLTQNEAEEVYPKWSPDGTRIAFESTRNSTPNGNRQIYVVNVDGSGLTNLSNNSWHNYLAVWSSDSKKIAFASHQEKGSQIIIADLTGDTTLSIATPDPQSEVNTISWSSDDEHIAFDTRTEAEATTHIIYRIDADGSNLQQLTDKSSTNLQPQWSPTGPDVLFWSDSGGELEIYVMDSDGENLHNLTRNAGSDAGGTWSPTGMHIAFQTGREQNLSSLYVMNSDGSNQHKIADQVMDFSYAWQPCPMNS